MSTGISRRRFLGAAAALGTAGAVELVAPGLAQASAVTSSGAKTLDDIEHFVILMQENRSFDEYFGLLSDVIGFSDPNALPGVFRQLDLERVGSPSGYVLPWRMVTKTTSAQSCAGLDHEWEVQHLMWNEGLMDQFLLGQGFETTVMGYFTRYDIPYHCALADAFTLCDRYHCSVLGPTDPNRIMLMTGTIDPQGLNGGPMIEDLALYNGQFDWTTFPEILQRAGVDWYVYQESDNYGDNMLPYFTAFADTWTDLYRRGNSFIPSTAVLGEATAEVIRRDVLNGTLPQVSWIIGPYETTEHPTATPGLGARYIDGILKALSADPVTWSKTLFILNYDENDGHFDHVLPPTPPIGTENEYLFNSAIGLGPNGPIGLGFRVPLILLSPLTRGPFVCSDIFDHTSVIKLLERRFNVYCPNISDWRRATVGDLTSAINFIGPSVGDIPSLPDVNALAKFVEAEANLPPPTMPTEQSMPTQETLPVRARPSGLVV
jgi:phospholipase C